MNDETWMILRAAAGAHSQSIPALVRRSGQAVTVVQAILAQYPKWFTNENERYRLTTEGYRALGIELGERQTVEITDNLYQDFITLTRSQGRVKREIDQVRATVDTALRRARILIQSGAVQSGLLLLGDADLTSVALGLLGIKRSVHIIDIDPDVLRTAEECARQTGLEVRLFQHDLREPLPSKYGTRFGAVFSDPPYAPEGFALFVERALYALRPEGRLWCCYGWSERSRERGLEKQTILTAEGVILDEIHPRFNRYDGALSIGATSHLFIGRKTRPSSKQSQVSSDVDLYTRRSPQ